MGKNKRKKRKGKAPVSTGPSPIKLTPPYVKLEQLGPFTWRVNKTKGMNVPGTIFANETLIDAVQKDQGAQQVANVATLPGIVGSALAMPDIHWGYGFPIGGVAAFDQDRGVVSPGGIGYDINCGVRLISTELSVGELGPHLDGLLSDLQASIPAGLGSKRRSIVLDKKELDRILAQGARAAMDMGYGQDLGVDRIEEYGQLDWADPGQVSTRARERGQKQLGTLGSGNHFVEIQRVDNVFDDKVAEVFGLFNGQMVLMIHTGSRGLGHQVCTEAVKTMGKAAQKAGIALPDRQLACAPLGTNEANDYLAAMAAAANFAFANRHVIAHLLQNSLESSLGISPKDHGCRLVYDVAHNIAKWEMHEVESKRKRVLVHRKGATRALGPGAEQLPDDLRPVGQPVLVPGDMGSASWVLVGTEEAAKLSFSSSCHGAGRQLSRSEALRKSKGRSIADELAHKGIIAKAESFRTLAEEMPEAYKDVDEVVEVVKGAGLCRPVARLVPLGVIKG